MLRARVLGLLLVLLAALPTPARAFCRMTTVEPPPGEVCTTEGIPLAWRRRCTSIAIEQTGSPDLPDGELRAIVERSFTHWLDVTCDGTPVDLELQLQAEPALCDLAEFNAESGNVQTLAFVSFDERGNDPSAFAFTTVWHNTRTGEILDVDMEINQDRGPYVVCPEPDGCILGGSRVDLENVLTHELGHYFGLGHTEDDPDATMIVSANPGEIEKRTLEADDMDGLCAIYPPGTLPDTCSFTPRNGLKRTCGEAPGCCSVTPRRRLSPLTLLTFTALVLLALVRRAR